MISSLDSHITWYWYEDGYQEVHSVLCTPHFSSLIDRYQDDGFGNATPVKACTDKPALDFILEDLH